MILSCVLDEQITYYLYNKSKNYKQRKNYTDKLLP